MCIIDNLTDHGCLLARQGIPNVLFPSRSNSTQEEGYYHEYCRLFLANIALTNQVKLLLEEKGQLSSRLGKYEDDEFNSQSERNADKGKRMRRNADEIERYYKCTVKSCAKSYGSEGSLNQHYKLKHPEIYLSLPNIQAVREEVEDKENRRRLVNKPR
jgi:hypothetical protein